jgi:pilus assembly protein Flp/PilA
MNAFDRLFLRDEEGSNAIEYALLAALIAIVMITAATAVGASLHDFLGSIPQMLSLP